MEIMIDECRVSSATIRNWEKLNTNTSGRLASRANKRKSKKRILPLEYISNKNNVSFVQSILDFIDESDIDIFSAIISLGVSLLVKNGLYNKPHVVAVLKEYANITIIDKLSTIKLPDDEFVKEAIF